MSKEKGSIIFQWRTSTSTFYCGSWM